MLNKKLKVSIIGTGAIGGYYGIMLARMEQDVHFLLNSDYDYVKANGLKLQSHLHNGINLPKVNAYNKATDMPVSDIVLVCLKTVQNHTVLASVLPEVTDENSLVILVQNGLGMEEDLSAAFPSLQIAGAVAMIGARKEKNGVIIHNDYGSIDFGSYNVKNLAPLKQLSSMFNFNQRSSSLQNLAYLRWKKLVWNMAFNGLSVLLNTTTDQIISLHLDHCKTIMHEVINGASACGVKLPLSFADDLIAFTKKMGDYAPSMKVDFDRSLPLELEYMYNKPILAARNMGYEMTVTNQLYMDLLEIDKSLR